MSNVWKYIQKIKNNDNVVISLNCQLCEAEYGVITSTATLRKHLITPINQPKQDSSYTFAEQIHITIKLAKWIAVNLQSFNIVEQEEFKQFVYTLDPCYVIPCRQTIKQEITSLFEQRKANIKLEINSL